MSREEFEVLYADYLTDKDCRSGEMPIVMDMNNIPNSALLSVEEMTDDYKNYMYDAIYVPEEVYKDLEDTKEQDKAKLKYQQNKLNEYVLANCGCYKHKEFKALIRQDYYGNYFVPCPKCLEKEMIIVDSERMLRDKERMKQKIEQLKMQKKGYSRSA